MRINLLALFPFFIAAPVVTQMGPPKPAPQLQKLKKLVGNYEGKGWVVMQPGADKMPWTATASCRFDLGNHWLVEDVRVEMGQGMSLVMRTFYGWDRERSRYVSHGVNNMGQVHSGRPHVSDKAILSGNVMTNPVGQHVVQRSKVTYTDAGYDMSIVESIDGGQFFEHVGGHFKRVEGIKAIAADAAFMGGSPDAAPPKQAARLARMAGKYRLEGKASMGPGMPMMEIAGSETMRMAYGNSILLMEIEGDPIPGMGPAYVGRGAIGWDASSNCYDFLWLDNMGDARVSEGRFTGARTFVTTWAGSYLGKPMTERSVMKLDKDGAIRSVVGDSATGAAPPTRNFEAELTRK